MNNPESVIRAWRAEPALFVREALGVEPQEWQAKALQALADHGRVSIRSGHGVGKSALGAWAILWELMTHFPVKIPCTAPTSHQLSDILWAELGMWFRRLEPALRDEFEIGQERIYMKAAPNESFAAARTARREQPEALQGFHAENLLFVIDEASGIDDQVFEVAEGALSTPGARVLMMGNPTRVSGYFYDSHHRLRSRWNAMRVPCTESDRVAPAYIEDMALKYGVDSNIYRVRVLGDFPTSDDDSVIPLLWLEEAVRREMEPVGDEIWGLDVARFGDDRTALCKRTKNALLEPVKTWRNKETMQVAGLVNEEYKAAKRKPVSINVDVIGIGSGVYDRLVELGLPAAPVNVSESPATKERFMRLRDELWFEAREWFESRNCRMVDDESLIGELCSVKYQIASNGKIRVESKDEMKKRKLPSPDLADAFVMTFAPAFGRSAKPLEFPKLGIV